jgi:putative membrane protein
MTMTSPGAKPLDVGTRLAVDRTRLAHERTLMAWVRTATSLISFGFTIYKFFQFELKGQPAHAETLIGARGFALIMIATGLVALALSTVEHRQNLRAMRREFGEIPTSTAAIVAGLVSLLGILAILAVLFHS